MAAKYVPEPDKAEELILETIRKITSSKSKQRASSGKICSELSKSHGLDKDTAKLQITMMLATNKIENKGKNGSESLKIVDNVSEYPKKQKKLLQDEDRLVTCQQELQAVANAESDSKTQVTGEADDSSETSEKDEHDVDCEAESQISESSTEASAFMPLDEMMIQRILNLEKKVEGILQQLAEKNKERTTIDRSQSEKYHEMQKKYHHWKK